MSIIEINNLTKCYGDKKAIDNVSFSVDSGDIYGFIGPNGAGKSTTIKILLNMIFKTCGNAKIFDIDVYTKSNVIKKDIGYVPSDVRFYDNMTPETLFKITLDFHNKKDDGQIEYFCNYFEIDKSKPMKDMSLGNKKKVAVVSAFIYKPKLIILDEPTNGLDPLMQIKLFEMIKEYNAKGVTFLVSSHNLNEVQQYCNKVVFIKKGKILDVYDINDLNKKVKRITVCFENQQTLNFGNIEIINQEQGKIEFLYKEDINKLLVELSKIELSNLLIEDYKLEDEFISHYIGDE